MPCDKCGKPHVNRCKAHRRDGEPCTQRPIKGTDKCRMHLGRKVAEVKAEVAAVQAVRSLQLDPDADPLDELLTEVQRAAAAVRWTQAKVNELADGALIGKHGPNVWVRLWQDERDRLAKVCKMALDAGVDERRVRLSESYGALVVEVIRATLAELGIEEDQNVGNVVARHLRAVG